ncbi:hypothetical protein LJM37_004152, partial [Serratia marcescens]
MTAPPAARPRPDAESDNVTAADGAFSPTISVFIIFACFQYDGAFFATGEEDICVYADGAK